MPSHVLLQKSHKGEASLTLGEHADESGRCLLLVSESNALVSLTKKKTYGVPEQLPCIQYAGTGNESAVVLAGAKNGAAAGCCALSMSRDKAGQSAVMGDPRSGETKSKRCEKCMRV